VKTIKSRKSSIPVAWTAALLASLGVVTGSRAQTVVYSADFEAAEGYVVGDLLGQNGCQLLQFHLQHRSVGAATLP
jgi:hypothetical protein